MKKTHNITIGGKACKIEYSDEITLSDAELARNTGRGVPFTGKITITEATDFYTVFEWSDSASNRNIADLKIKYSKFQILPDGSFKDLGVKEIGVSVFYFVEFMNNSFPQSNVFLITGTAVNRVLQDSFGEGDYECRAFTSQNLTPMQPLLFNLLPSGTKITVDVTDSDGECTYSLDEINWFNDNVFLNLQEGEYTVHVKDSNGYINKKNTTISNI